MNATIHHFTPLVYYFFPREGGRGRRGGREGGGEGRGGRKERGEVGEGGARGRNKNK